MKEKYYKNVNFGGKKIEGGRFPEK